MYFPATTPFLRGLPLTEISVFLCYTPARRHHRAKGGVAGLKVAARTKTTIARSSDPLGIHDMVIKICDPALNGAVVLEGRVTWFDPVRSIYCIVESSGGPVGSGGESPSRAGTTHWISAEKLVEAKAIAFNKRQRSTFIVKMLPTAAELEAQRRAAAATADTAQEAERGGAANGTARDGDGRGHLNVEEAGAGSGRRAKTEEVVERGQTTKERLSDRKVGGSTKDGVGEDPDATESEGEENVNRRSSSSHGRSGQDSPKMASAESDPQEMQEVTPAGQTQSRPQAQEAISKGEAPQRQVEISTEEDAEAPKAQAVAEVGEQRDARFQSGGEEARTRSRQQKIELETSEDVANPAVAATAAQPSPPLRAVFPPPESTTEQAPRYPLRMTRSRSQPESMTPSAKRQRLAPQETTALTPDGLPASVTGTDGMASREDAGTAQVAVHSEETSSPTKRPKIAENDDVSSSKMGKPESEADVEQMAVGDGNSGVAAVDSGGSAGESLHAYDTTQREKAAVESAPVVAARAPPTDCEATGGSGEHLQPVAEGPLVDSPPPPAFTVQAGWAGMEVFGQVPVMHVRSIRLPGTQASSAGRGNSNNATYFASAYAGVGVTMVEAHSSGRPRRFSFSFEQVEKIRKSNQRVIREPHSDDGPAMPESVNSVKPTAIHRSVYGRREDVVDCRENVEDGVAENAADEHEEEGVGRAEEKQFNGEQIGPSIPPDSGADTASSRGELRNKGIEMVSDGKSDIISLHPRQRDMDSAVNIHSDGADSLANVEALGDESKQAVGDVDHREQIGSSQTTENVRRGSAAVAAPGSGIERHHGVDGGLDEDSMEISSISSDAESSEASNGSASDISSDADDDAGDNDRKNDTGPRVDRIPTDRDNLSSAVATSGSSSEGSSGENGGGQGAVESNHSHAENPPWTTNPDEHASDDTLNLKEESAGSPSPDASLISVTAESTHDVTTTRVEEPDEGGPLSITSAVMETSVPDVEGSNEAASSSTASAVAGMNLPPIAVPVTRPVATPLDLGLSTSGPPSDPRRPPSDPRRAPSDPRRARNDRRRSAADPRRPKPDRGRPSKQNITSDPDNYDGLNDAWKDLLYGGEGMGRATAFAHHVRPPTPPPPRPPSPPLINEATLALRGIVREQIENVLRSASQGRAASLGDEADMMLERVSSEIEEELFNRLFYGASDRNEGERAYKVSILLCSGLLRVLLP